MAYLKIMPGVSTLSDAGHVLSVAALRPSEDIRDKVLARDKDTCRYCGFPSKKYQEIAYIGKGNADISPGSYATACIFCYQCMHLDLVEPMQSGAVVWLPEIAQAALHHICRAIYVARISQGPMADAARDALELLLARREEAKNRLGTDSPKILASVLQDFLEQPEYQKRAGRLKGFRILPMDRRIIREGDLEFNQFPQILAFWRSKDGPFGENPPRTWVKTFYEIQEKLTGNQDPAPVEGQEAG